MEGFGSDLTPHEAFADLSTVGVRRSVAFPGVYVVSLSRPRKMNAMNAQFWREWRVAFEVSLRRSSSCCGGGAQCSRHRHARSSTRSSVLTLPLSPSLFS